MVEAIDGVDVTVPNDSLEEQNPEWKKGSKSALDAENAEAFVRYRSTEKSQSALEHLERQIAFLIACGGRKQHKSIVNLRLWLRTSMKN